MRKSFLLHIDSLCILDDLTDEQKGQLFNAIYQFQLGNKIELSSIIKIAFSQFKNQFMRDAEKYEKTCEARKLAGSKGGKQKVANATNSKQKVANVAESDNDSKSKNKSDSKNKEEPIKPLENLKDEFEPIWKDYSLTFLKAKGRGGGVKKKAKANFNKLIAKYSLTQILDLIEAHKKLKIGHKDLERLLTINYMKQFLEDSTTAPTGLVPIDWIGKKFIYGEYRCEFTEKGYFNITQDYEVTNTQDVKNIIEGIKNAG